MTETTHLKESFNTIASHYDNIRPDYPEALVEAALAHIPNQPTHTLEVGCGSGQATQLFAPHLTTIVATDPGAELIALAQQRLAQWTNITFIVSAFEQLDLPHHSFDLLISAQAFHWVDPSIALPKASQLLKSSGIIALFWNFFHYDANKMLASLRDIIVRHVPMFTNWPDSSDAQFDHFAATWMQRLRENVVFVQPEQHVFHTTRSYTSEQYHALIESFSWYHTQASHVQQALIHDINRVVANQPLAIPVRTLLITAHTME